MTRPTLAIVILLALVAVNVFAAPSAAPDHEGLQGQRGAPHAITAADVTTAGTSLGGAPLPAAASMQPASPDVAMPAKTSGVASWFRARGDQGAVPWWRPGQAPVWAAVCAFPNGRTVCVDGGIWITGFCQCLVGEPGERVIDLSDDAFSQLAPLSQGLVIVQVDIPTQGPRVTLPPIALADDRLNKRGDPIACHIYLVEALAGHRLSDELQDEARALLEARDGG